jgi:hypothetical protein
MGTARVADGERGEHLRDEPGLREVELEQVGVAVLDDDGGRAGTVAMSASA